ncbi:ADP-ribose pyrophosphatase [bacterium BMS3Abin03]|nr:ADP-ribose pyrophosphatase [bacterium BMS3Abin03]
MNFKVKKSEILFRGKVFNLKVDEIQYNSGNASVREVVVHPGGAVIVPITDEGKIIMVKQFRYPFQKELLELPAGKLEDSEDPFDCALRELEEETGYKSGDVEKLGKIYTAPGYSSEVLHIFSAKNLKPGNLNREEGEDGMQVFEYPLNEIERKILSGEIVDGKSICGIYLFKNKLFNN